MDEEEVQEAMLYEDEDIAGIDLRVGRGRREGKKGSVSELSGQKVGMGKGE